VELPHRWELFHTLLEDFSAADSTLLRHDNKWWLFCTSSESFRRGHNSHLYIWYADELYGTWKPHPRNPVKIDIRSSRPAGQFFTHGGNVYRPAQDCSRTYGGALRINRIDKLSESEFEERTVGTITPPRKSYNKGIHTISLAGDYCIVDAKRYVFNRAGIMILCRLAGKAVLLRLGVRPQTLASIKKRLGLWPANTSNETPKQDSARIVASHPPIARDP
jgi:hypothetical protein